MAEQYRQLGEVPLVERALGLYEQSGELAVL
jgi:hypothetical protein